MDVHARNTVYVVQDSEGRILHRGRVTTDEKGVKELVDRLGGECGAKAGLESGSQSFWVSEVPSGLGMHPYVISAQEVRAKSRRPNQKSDSRDAFEICDGLRRDIYTSMVYVPSREARQLRTLLYRRRHFVRLCTSQVNAAKSILRSEGVIISFGCLTTWASWEKLLSRIEDPFFKDMVLMHAEVWREAQDKVEKLEEKLKFVSRAFKGVYDHLVTIPGVGKITALTFIAVIADPFRFPASGEVVSYLGLSPSGWETGDRVVHGHITKRGNAELRAMLVETAHHASNVKHPLNPYFSRVCAKHGYKKAVVYIAQRLSRILWRMWIADEDFDVSKLNVVKESRTTTLVVKGHGAFRSSGAPLLFWC